MFENKKPAAWGFQAALRFVEFWLILALVNNDCLRAEGIQALGHGRVVQNVIP
jgi:hypothetical protein